MPIPGTRSTMHPHAWFAAAASVGQYNAPPASVGAVAFGSSQHPVALLETWRSPVSWLDPSRAAFLPSVPLRCRQASGGPVTWSVMPVHRAQSAGHPWLAAVALSRSSSRLGSRRRLPARSGGRPVVAPWIVWATASRRSLDPFEQPQPRVGGQPNRSCGVRMFAGPLPIPRHDRRSHAKAAPSARSVSGPPVQVVPVGVPPIAERPHRRNRRLVSLPGLAP